VCRASSGGSVLHVDEPAEAIAAADLVRACRPLSPVVRWPQLERPMRPEVGERITIGSDSGIVRTIEPQRHEPELRLVVAAPGGATGT
jgi:hypothetical protein